jgi:hypothetical protein
MRFHLQSWNTDGNVARVGDVGDVGFVGDEENQIWVVLLGKI